MKLLEKIKYRVQLLEKVDIQTNSDKVVSSISKCSSMSRRLHKCSARLLVSLWLVYLRPFNLGYLGTKIGSTVVLSMLKK